VGDADGVPHATDVVGNRGEYVGNGRPLKAIRVHGSPPLRRTEVLVRGDLM